MDRITAVTVTYLLLCGWCVAEGPATKPTAEALTDAQRREVEKYRSEKRASEEKRIEWLEDQVANPKEATSEDARKKQQKALEDARKTLEKLDRRTDSDIWKTLESSWRERGFKWQEPTVSEDGETGVGRWVEALTASQMEEVRTWTRKEIDFRKQVQQWKLERAEAVQSGDTEKRRLIDGKTYGLQNRKPFPIGAHPADQWDFIVKEQDLRGLEWHEPSAEKGRRPDPGRWQKK